jgi:hypothetical protein
MQRNVRKQFHRVRPELAEHVRRESARLPMPTFRSPPICANSSASCLALFVVVPSFNKLPRTEATLYCSGV